MREDYSDQLDSLDASVFTGELLYTNMEEFEDYLKRWQRALESHKKMYEDKCQCGYDTCAECNSVVEETA